MLSFARTFANGLLSATIDDLLTAMVSTHTETSTPKFETPNAKIISLNHQLAYESFGDTILGACLRLKRLIRTETHYEVYDAESLSDGNQKYEVRAYNLRGLSLKVRNYRIRNLKRASARSSCIGSLEQGGKKWLVLADPQADLIPESSGACSPLWSTRDEYERAFPVLESHKPDDSEKIEKEALQDRVVVEAYDVSFEKALEDELSKRLDAKQALEVIDRVRERLVASSKPCHPDDKIRPMSEKQKKPKSPEQAKRLRDRQRLSRQTKRRVKTALRLVANGDNMSQTVDTASEPPTETSLGKENNHGPADKTFAIQIRNQLRRLLRTPFNRMKMHDYPTSAYGHICPNELWGDDSCLSELEGAHEWLRELLEAADETLYYQLQKYLDRHYVCSTCLYRIHSERCVFE